MTLSLPLRSRTVFSTHAYRLGLSMLAVLALALALPALAMAAAGTGVLIQPDPTAGCLVNDTASADPNCALLAKLDGPRGVVVSPEGKRVYVAVPANDVIHVFDRDKKTSTLSNHQCFTNTIVTGCTKLTPMNGPYALSMSPDGKFLYAGLDSADAVVAFSVDKKTGALSNPTCVNNGGTNPCVKAQPLNGPDALTLSHDGKYVFVAVKQSDAVLALNRNKSTGIMGKVNCISNAVSSVGCTEWTDVLNGAADVAASQDGKHLYVASSLSNSVAAFSITKTSGAITPLGCVSVAGTEGSNLTAACTANAALTGAQGVAITADGKQVYVVANTTGAVVAFNRDKKTGLLTFLDCISNGGAGGCTAGTNLDGAYGIAVSHDGKNLYVTARTSDAVAVFSRDKKTGLLTQITPDECKTVSGDPCNGLNGALGIDVAKDGQSVYVTTDPGNTIGIFSRD